MYLTLEWNTDQYVFDYALRKISPIVNKSYLNISFTNLENIKDTKVAFISI